jgi:chromatin remodeling complex protein RSC6
VAPLKRKTCRRERGRQLIGWLAAEKMASQPSGVALPFAAHGAQRITRAYAASARHQLINCPVMENEDMATAKKAAAPKAPAKKVAAKAAAPVKKAAAPAKKVAAAAVVEAAPVEAKRAPNAAFMKALQPSAALAAVVGKEPLPRTEVTKKVWEYIKKHNLQDAANKRMINADAKLKKIFGKDQVSMFEMTKLISNQLS